MIFVTRTSRTATYNRHSAFKLSARLSQLPLSGVWIFTGERLSPHRYNMQPQRATRFRSCHFKGFHIRSKASAGFSRKLQRLAHSSWPKTRDLCLPRPMKTPSSSAFVELLVANTCTWPNPSKTCRKALLRTKYPPKLDSSGQALMTSYPMTLENLAGALSLSLMSPGADCRCAGYPYQLTFLNMPKDHHHGVVSDGGTSLIAVRRISFITWCLKKQREHAQSRWARVAFG